MKTDRLLEIIIYLLNHEKATAKQLADRFGVSVRTVQRDIDSVSEIGVPVLAMAGTNGGYAIDPDYKIRNQYIGKDEFSLIILALKSLSTGYDNSSLEAILEKYLSVDRMSEPSVYLDYSVTKENASVVERNKLIEAAIKRSVQIRFDYRNAKGTVSSKTVRPLALRFKWYAWYLFAFDTEKKDYRTYKIIRMSSLTATDLSFQRPKNLKQLILENERNYDATCEKIEVWCGRDGITELEEYFPGEQKEQTEDGNYIMHLRVPPGEKLWKAMLLVMGNKVRILGPEPYKKDLCDIAASFLKNHDIQMS